MALPVKFELESEPVYSERPIRHLSLEEVVSFYQLLANAGYNPEEFLEVLRPHKPFNDPFFEEVRELAQVEPDLLEIGQAQLALMDQYMLVQFLEDHPESKDIYELAEHLGLTKDELAQVIEELPEVPEEVIETVRRNYERILSPSEQLESARSQSLLPIRCRSCGSVFREAYQVIRYLTEKGIDRAELMRLLGISHDCCLVAYLNPEVHLWFSEIVKERLIGSANSQIRRVYEHRPLKELRSALLLLKYK